jgi:hypothetical protein
MAFDPTSILDSLHALKANEEHDVLPGRRKILRDGPERQRVPMDFKLANLLFADEMRPPHEISASGPA